MTLDPESAGNLKTSAPSPETGVGALERFAFEEAPVALAQISTEGVCLTLNRRLRQFLGYSGVREPTVSLDSFVLPGDVEVGRRARARMLSGEVGECAFVQRFIREDGAILPSNLKVSLARDKDARPLFFIAVFEERSPPDTDSEWKECYEIILRVTRQVTYELDLENGELKLGGDVEHLTGYTREELSGGWDRWKMLIHPEDQLVLEQRHQSPDDDRPYHLEYRLLRKDGSVANVRDDGCVATGSAPGHLRIMGVLLDVSEQRSLALQLQHAQKMEVFGRLAGGVAHDFNNLLTVFSGYTELLLGDFPSSDPKREYLEEMQRAAERAVALTSQLLAFGRLQRSSPRLIQLGEVLLELRKMLRRLIGEDIELVTTVADGVGLVFADPRQIETVLINFAVNARDAMPHGGRLSISASNLSVRSGDKRAVAGWEVGPYVQIVVGDTGTGIDPALFTRIFEPFFTTKGPGEGTGLGLSTCYGIIKQCGGRIDVESTPGMGSTFRICLPRAYKQEGSELTDEPIGVRARGKLPKGKGETILFVEDDPAVQRIYTTMLRRLGYVVLPCSNGDEAMRIAGDHREIALVLTDLVMPLMSGTELAEELRHLLPKAKIVFISGYASEPGGHSGPIKGTTFLAKPLSRDTLASKLRELIESV